MTYEDKQQLEPWGWNGRFKIKKTVIKNVVIRHQPPIQPDAWQSSFSFTSHDHVKQKALRSYRTYGMYFYSGTIVYARTLNNMTSALCRMFQPRINEEQLLSNQRSFCRMGTRRNKSVITKIVNCVLNQFDMIDETDDISGAFKFSETTHVKKELRQKAFRELLVGGKFHSETYASIATAKVKIETAKTGKNARVYVDMTTPQSLLGGWLIDTLKRAMGVIDLGWCVFKFVAHTDEKSMQESFEFIRDNAHRPCMVYHSDDAIVSVPTREGPLFFDLDISSCDRSNSEPIFDLLVNMVPEPYRRYFKRMCRAAQIPLVIPNPEDSKEKIFAVPTQPFEYSGINITTVLNNVASLMIGVALFYNHKSDVTRNHMIDSIPERAKSAGYIVTVKPWSRFEQLQFLKFSPSDIVNCFPVRNLGCILRAIGHIDGDFHKTSSTLYDRARDHISSVVSGITCGYIDPVAAVLRKKWHRNKTNPRHVKYQYSMLGWSVDVGNEHLAHRYDLSFGEIQHLLDLVTQADVGDIVVSTTLSKIFKMDYG